MKGCVAQWFGSQRHGQKALILEGDDSATRERLEGKLANKEMEKKLSIHLELHSMWNSKSVLKQGARGRGTPAHRPCPVWSWPVTAVERRRRRRGCKLHGEGAPLRASVGFWRSSALGMGNHTPQAQLRRATALKTRPCLHRPDVCPVCLLTPQIQI